MTTTRKNHFPGARDRITLDRTLKPTAYLINVARGPIIDEAALIEALRAGRIAGAGVDVFENERPILPTRF